MFTAQKNYTSYQFAAFRILFSVYLIIHFAMLLPDAAAIWSSTGSLSDSSLNFTYGFFPNLLNYWDSPRFVTLFVGIQLVLSITLILGWKRPWVCLLLWYGWACLFHRNNLISNPGLPMVGWVFLAMALIPQRENWSLDHFWNKNTQTTDWYMPKALYIGAWIILGLSYTISGIDKINSPSWTNGTAFIHLLDNPLARDSWLRELLLKMPTIILKGMTYSALALEILFGFFCLFRKLRFFAWIAILLMHFGILMIIDFADLTLGVLILHLFVIDPKWFQFSKHKNKDCIIFFDGVCGLCNSAVDTLLGMDYEGRFLCAPLQGSTAKTKLSADTLDKLDTIHYIEGSKHFQKSSAILRILMRIGGIWYFAGAFLILPKFIRDTAYDFIASNRYKWFGKHDTCRFPTPEERARFLD